METREQIEKVSELMGANGSAGQAERLLAHHAIIEIEAMTDEEFFCAWSASEQEAGWPEANQY